MPLKNRRSRRMPRPTELARERSSVSGTPIAEFGEASIAALCCRDIAVRPFVTSNRSEEHTSELQSQSNLVCRLLLEKKKQKQHIPTLTDSCIMTVAQ